MNTTIPTITSITRPISGLTAGDQYFETDTKNYIIYDGTGWRIYEDDDTTANTLSLEFDGDDRLDTSYSMTSVQSFTCMFWMKSTDTTNYMALVSDRAISGTTLGNLQLLRTSNPEANGFYVLFRSTGLNNNFKNGITSFNDLCDGDWHHVALVFDSSGTYTNVTIYKDGDPHEENGEDARIDNGWNTDDKVYGTSATPFAFGQRRDNVLPYTGKMDQMAFFESALTGTQISNIYNGGNGGDLLALGFSPAAYYRVGYYSEDTNSNSSRASAGNNIGTVADYSGNGYDASQLTVSKQPKYVADTRWS